MIDDVTNFAIRIEKVPEFSRSRWTGFDTRWISPCPHSLDAESALFDGRLHPRPIPQVVDRGVNLLLWNVWFCPVENPPFIGAGCNAVPATDAPVVVHHDDAVGFLPGGVDRADFHARGVLTLLALNRKVGEPFLRYEVRVVVMVRVLEIDQISPPQAEDSDPVELRIIAGVVVFLYTGIDAPSAANASRKLKAIAPKGFGDCFLSADLEFSPVFFQVPPLEVCDDAPLVFFRHLVEMLLKKVLDFFLRTGREKRKRKAGQNHERKISDKLPSGVMLT